MMAVSSPVLNSSLDSNGSSNSNMNQCNGDSPKNRSSSFSISAILSDEIGSQKRPSLRTPSMPTNEWRHPSSETVEQRDCLQTPKRPKDLDCSREAVLRRPQITLMEAANLISPAGTNTVQVHPTHPVAAMGRSTPPLHSTRQHNSSLSASPFDPSFLHTLGQQSSMTDKDDFLSDSLGMLSTVALYHSSLGTPVQNRLADIRITSSCDESDKSEEWNGGNPAINISQAPLNKSRTPCILKRRQRKTSMASVSDSCASDESGVGHSSRTNHTYLNTGFLSPLSNEKSSLNNQLSGFSPSIFLSRPDQSTSAMATTPPHHKEGCDSRVGGVTSAVYQSPMSNVDSAQNQAVEIGGSFATSTPIKTNKENVQSGESAGYAVGRRKGGWSPNILRSGRRHLLKDTNDSSSGSDSELPVKRSLSSPLSPPQKRRKKSKARTKLSPLLENACSPIEKGDHTYQPSPLTLSTTPTRPQAPPTLQNSTNTAPATSSIQNPSRPLHPLHLPTTCQPSSINTVGLNSQLFSSNSKSGTVDKHHISSPSGQYLSSSMGQTFSLPQSHPQAMLPQFPHRPFFPSPQPTLPYPMNSFQNPFQCLSPPYGQPLLNPSLSSSGLQQGVESTQFMPLPFYLPGSNTGGGFVQLQVMSNPQLPYNGTSFAAPNSSTFGTFPNCQGYPLSLYGSNQATSSAMPVKGDGKMKSVPPWFIFSSKRPEGKRNRLTEAINKSLSETPSQNTKLPVEWTKYACGQTNDQKEMTETARSFLQCQPRTLNFDEDS